MTGRSLPPSSPFAGDDGAADPALAAALHGSAPGEGVAAVVAALRTARVLVPMLAQAEVTEEGADGLAHDREASTGVVAVRTPDGRTALPVFSGVDALERWHARARPVPAEGPRAAVAALQEGWELLVVDPGGPATVVVPHPAVRALATGDAWQPAVVDGAVRAGVGAMLAEVLTGVDGLRAVAAQPGRRAEVAVVLALAPGMDRARLDATVAAAGRALAADERVTATIDSLELRVVASG